MIERKVVSGTGSATVDITGGYVYTKVKNVSDVTSIHIYSSSAAWNTINYGPKGIGEGITLTGLTSLKVTAAPDQKWTLELHKNFPATNQSELKMTFTDAGLAISGDDDITYLGQGIDPATVDIVGIRTNVEELSSLYAKANVTKTATDAARYLKLKAAVLALY